MLSVCGLLCDECYGYKQGCAGCQDVKGKPFWTKEMNVGVCELYRCCVDEKQFQHCGQCSSLPCKLFLELKDPSISDDAHAEGIKLRVERLGSV